jgi:hypothetical protein
VRKALGYEVFRGAGPQPRAGGEEVEGVSLSPGRSLGERATLAWALAQPGSVLRQ